jgi:hypothetical protein
MKRFATGLAVLLGAGLVAAQVPAGGAKPITSVYGHDLRVRPGGQKDFTKETPKVGVDFFHDAANGCLLAVTETGNLAAAPFPTLAAKKEAEWVYGFDLRVRKSDAETFANAKKYGVEGFRDLASGLMLYVSEAKAIALGGLPAMTVDKEAGFHHGLVLSVRDAKQQEWKDAKKFGAEAFRDGNTAGLLYLTETGAVATAAGPAAAPPDPPKAPTWAHGMVLRVRKADEEDFTAQTRNLSVETYTDPNSGALLFVSETGSLATAPAPTGIKKGQAPQWKGAFKLRARKGGEADFAKAAKFGVEVFEDVATGCLVYACETGSIAVVKK